MGYSGAGGKLIHEKTRGKKSRDTVPLKWFLFGFINFFELVLATAVKIVKRCWLF
jgi:hypothetical protein